MDSAEARVVVQPEGVRSLSTRGLRIARAWDLVQRHGRDRLLHDLYWRGRPESVHDQRAQTHTFLNLLLGLVEDLRGELTEWQV